MASQIDYSESLSSKRTEVLFVALTLLFAGLWVGRRWAIGWDGLGILLAVSAAFFAFYALNYRELHIRLTSDGLTLRFGIFTWRVAASNMERWSVDETSLWRIGGAGIHFSPISGRYGALFNFLEHPRIVIALKVKQGLVRDVAFSTRNPEHVLQLIQAMNSGSP